MSSFQTANLAPIPILTYHQIEHAPPKGAPYRGLYVSPSAFNRQMAMLKLLGYQGLSMSRLMPYLRGELQGKVVGISFDDGYLNNMNNALPVLQKYGFTSTCYAVSQLLGKSNEWDRDIGIAQTPLMTAVQLEAWVAGGQEVGAHTRRHAHLTQLDVASCQDEIELSKAELEAMTHSPISHFCYPYGDFNEETAKMVGRAGFQTATTTQRSRCHAGEDLLKLPRVPVFRTTSLLSFGLKLLTAYEDIRRQ
jgi:peptidoglycan/xylan/chitin deacetylase (PgdA/CDA1 family)